MNVAGLHTVKVGVKLAEPRIHYFFVECLTTDAAIATLLLAWTLPLKFLF